MMAERWIIWKALAMGAGLGGATLLIAGVPSDVIANPWFTRMTPVRPQDYVFLGLTAMLAATLGATYAFPAVCPFQPGKYGVGTYLSVLAVGCPICNKVVVLLLGISGALTIFQPMQPILAVGGLALLGYALTVRLRALRAWPGAEARGAARGM